MDPSSASYFLSRRSLCLLLLLSASSVHFSDAWIQMSRPSAATASSRQDKMQLHMFNANLWMAMNGMGSVSSEGRLRQEIADRNTLKEGEEKYAVVDGAMYEKLADFETTDLGSTSVEEASAILETPAAIIEEAANSTIDASTGIASAIKTETATAEMSVGTEERDEIASVVMTTATATLEVEDTTEDDADTDVNADADADADASTSPIPVPAPLPVVNENAASSSPSSTTESSEPKSSDSASLSSSSHITAKIERLTKTRAYPLFLAEKAAEVVELTLGGLTKSSLSPSDYANANGASNTKTKERVVVLGTGWAAASFLKEIDTDLYDVTVISPRNYFLFTPMLAGASVGTVEYRSITESIREINNKAYYIEGTATHIDLESNSVTCETVVCEGNSCEIEEFTVNYDRLIVTIGAQTNTFGIPGVREYCSFLKQIEDAQRIRTSIVHCFERANLPGLSDQERIDKLTFAVIGAGPTGIEFAAELRDFVEQDGPKYYPHLLKYVRIKVIEASSTVLAPFDKSLQEEAIRQMNRAVEIRDPDIRNLLPERFKLTELLLDSSVKEVGEKVITLNDGTVIPYGIAVWAAGNGPIPLTLQLIESLGEEQAELQNVARGRIAIDKWMRAKGGEGKVLALGDCTCITSDQLPATAQVASQQGEYIASIMNKRFNLSPPRADDGVFLPPVKDPENTETTLSDAIANFATNSNGEYAKPFQFLNMGILAYTGSGSALAQVNPSPNSKPIKGTGKIGNALWKSVYLTKQVSWRNRFLVLNDWAKRQIFGRDITRL